jgi:dipeptide/tripeptide permease
MKVAKKGYKFVINLGMMAMVVAGSFLGSAIAMNLFIGVTILGVIIFTLGHLAAEKTVENNPEVAKDSKKLWNGKLSVIQYVVIFVCLAGSGHWILFFTWIIILFASIALTERYKQMLKEAETEKHEDGHTKVSDIIDEIKTTH